MYASRVVGLAVLAAVSVIAPAHAQQFVQETTTRFPVQAEYTNQSTVVDIDNDGDLDIVWANGQDIPRKVQPLQCASM